MTGTYAGLICPMADATKPPEASANGSASAAPHQDTKPICAFCNEGEDSDDADDDMVVDTKHMLKDRKIYAHENCLDWTGDIWQDEAYAWCNVQKSLSRSRKLKCAKCGEFGASLGCKRSACSKSWHVPCAFEPTEKLVIDEDNQLVGCAACVKILEREEEQKLLKGQAAPPAKRAKGSGGVPGESADARAERAQKQAEKAEAEVARLHRDLAGVRERAKLNIEKKIEARKAQSQAEAERDEAKASLEEMGERPTREAYAAAKGEAEEAKGEAARARAQLRAIQGEAEALASLSCEEVEQLAALNAAAQVNLLRQCEVLRRREEQETAERAVCSVCMASPRGVVFLPCGHVACCKACSEREEVRACPLCKQSVESRHEVFLP